MPGAIDIVRLLPALIRLCPELVTGSVSVGKLVPIGNVTPLTDEQLDRELARKTKAKPRKSFNDAVHVVKVSDAIACIETKFSDTTLIKEFLLSASQSLFSGFTASTPSQRLCDQMADCIRDKSLNQKTPRSTVRKTSHGRPARGHGRGK